MADALDRSLFSPGQVATFDAVMRWTRANESAQVFRLFGYAGTGKTVIARSLAQEIGGDVAFTGKAALVMRRSGCHDAATIQSLIYTVQEMERTQRVPPWPRLRRGQVRPNCGGRVLHGRWRPCPLPAVLPQARLGPR